MRDSRHAALGMVLQLAGRVAKVLAGVLAFGITSRALGVQPFGDYVFVFAYILLFSTLASFGVDSIVIRDLAQLAPMSDRYCRAIGVSVSTKIILSALAIFFSIDIGVLMQLPTHVVMDIAIFSPYILVTAFGSNGLVGDILQARHRNGSIAISSTIAAFATVVLTGIAAVAHAGVPAYLSAYIIAGLADFCVGYVLVRRLARLRFQWHLSMMSYLLSESFPIGVATVFVLIYVRIDTVLLEKLTNPGQVALYGVAYKFFDVLSTVSATVMLVFFPYMARAHSIHRDALQSLYQRIFALTLAMALPIGYFIVAFRQVLIAIIVGPGYDAAQLAIPGLILAAVLMFPGSVASYMLVVTHLQKWNLVLAVSATILNVGLNLILIPHGGYVAASWTTAVTEVYAIAFDVVVVIMAYRQSPFSGILAVPVVAMLSFGVIFVPGVSPYISGTLGLVLYVAVIAVYGLLRPAQIRWLVSLPASTPSKPHESLLDDESSELRHAGEQDRSQVRNGAHVTVNSLYHTQSVDGADVAPGLQQGPLHTSNGAVPKPTSEA